MERDTWCPRLLILSVRLVAINRMSTNILPEINIPVISVIWQYAGMPADEVEELLVAVEEEPSHGVGRGPPPSCRERSAGTRAGRQFRGPSGTTELTGRFPRARGFVAS
jgi:hypothetical protein